MSMIPHDTLVVVADGRAARLFRNVGDEAALRLRQVETLGPTDAADAGPSGSQPRENDIGEAAFAKVLADRINSAALRNGFEHIVLAADPATLGELRPQLHKEVGQRMLAELAKDWTNVPLDRIEARDTSNHLRQVIGEPGVVGFATDLVRYNPQIATAVQFLLGNVIVVQNLDVAVALEQRDPMGARGGQHLHVRHHVDRALDHGGQGRLWGASRIAPSMTMARPRTSAHSRVFIARSR